MRWLMQENDRLRTRVADLERELAVLNDRNARQVRTIQAGWARISDLRGRLDKALARLRPAQERPRHPTARERAEAAFRR